MKLAELEQLLAGLRPEMALAVLVAVPALTLLAGYLYLVRPSLGQLQELDAQGPRATLESLTADLQQGSHHLLAIGPRADDHEPNVGP